MLAANVYIHLVSELHRHLLFSDKVEKIFTAKCSDSIKLSMISCSVLRDTITQSIVYKSGILQHILCRS